MSNDAIRPLIRPFMTCLSLSRPTLKEMAKWYPNVTLSRFRAVPPTIPQSEAAATATTTIISPAHFEPQIPTPTRYMSSLRGRDLAAFLLFSEERRRQLLKATPGMSFKEVTTILEEEWETMSQNQRATWRRTVDGEEEPAAQSQSRTSAVAASTKPVAAYHTATTTTTTRPPMAVANPEASYVNLPKLPRGAYHYDPVKPGMTASDIDEAKADLEASLLYEQMRALPTTRTERVVQTRKREEEARRNGEEMMWREEGEWEEIRNGDVLKEGERMFVPVVEGEILEESPGHRKSVAGSLLEGGRRAVKWVMKKGEDGEEGEEEMIQEDWVYDPQTKVDTRKHDPAVQGSQAGVEAMNRDEKEKMYPPRRYKTKMDRLEDCVEAVGYGASLVDKYAEKKM